MHQHGTRAIEFTSVLIDVRRSAVDCSIIRIQGELRNGVTAPVWRTLETELGRSPEQVALDLSGVTAIDKAGIGVLVAAATHAGESDISFCLIGAQESAVGAALADADLTELFEILPPRTDP
jgi:anti-anti-sigma factor